jgi:hypothetical protein
MGESVEAFAGFIQRCFDERREAEYIARCTVPMTVYSDRGGLAVATTRAQLAEMVVDAWAAIRAAAPRVEIRTVAVGLPQRRGFPARIDWRFLDAAGGLIHTLEMRYFLARAPSGRLHVEMIEIYGPGCARTLAAPPAATG